MNESFIQKEDFMNKLVCTRRVPYRTAGGTDAHMI